MRRRTTLATVGLVVVGAALASGCGSSDQATRLPGGHAVVSATSFTPPSHLFAEPVTAQIDVIVDPHKLDPSRIHLHTDFKPYEVLSATRARQSLGGLTRFHYVFTLRCLLIECIPKILPSAAGPEESGRGDRLTFTFPRARILYHDPTGKTRSVGTAAWPTLESVSRINASSIPENGPGSQFIFKTSVTPLPAATYRISPTMLAVLLIALACLLLTLPAVLLYRWWRARHPEVVEEETPEVPPLEKALRLVEWTAGRDVVPEKREALEVLAAELDAEGLPLADSARRVAWSPPPPPRPDTDELVDTVRGSNDSSS
ncbi:MAG TPA: hypothetical protein VFK76_05415 [Gaiellaceae bacterium]|nr:hypothetical protein [Gaiellaceae bacterium]